MRPHSSSSNLGKSPTPISAPTEAHTGADVSDEAVNDELCLSPTPTAYMVNDESFPVTHVTHVTAAQPTDSSVQFSKNVFATGNNANDNDDNKKPTDSKISFAPVQVHIYRNGMVLLEGSRPFHGVSFLVWLVFIR